MLPVTPQQLSAVRYCLGLYSELSAQGRPFRLMEVERLGQSAIQLLHQLILSGQWKSLLKKSLEGSGPYCQENCGRESVGETNWVGPNRIDREDQMILVLGDIWKWWESNHLINFKSIIIDAGVSMLIWCCVFFRVDGCHETSGYLRMVVLGFIKSHHKTLAVCWNCF